jgi:heat shock 70kDa protein 4
MPWAGFDVGNAFSCVALAGDQAPEVVENDKGKCEMPSIVSFTEKMRCVGCKGIDYLVLNGENTVVHVKRLLGRKFDSPDVQKDIKQKFVFKVNEGTDGCCMLSVSYLGQRVQMSPAQVIATLLKELKDSAETRQTSRITDCVLAVPAYFGELERSAMLAASGVAGLNCLHLMNDLSAAALHWAYCNAGLLKTGLQNVALVDVGHSATQASFRPPHVCLGRQGSQSLSHQLPHLAPENRTPCRSA